MISLLQTKARSLELTVDMKGANGKGQSRASFLPAVWRAPCDPGHMAGCTHNTSKQAGGPGVALAGQDMPVRALATDRPVAMDGSWSFHAFPAKESSRVLASGLCYSHLFPARADAQM